MTSKQYKEAVKQAGRQILRGEKHFECTCGEIKLLVGLDRGSLLLKCTACDKEYLLPVLCAACERDVFA